MRSVYLLRPTKKSQTKRWFDATLKRTLIAAAPLAADEPITPADLTLPSESDLDKVEKAFKTVFEIVDDAAKYGPSTAAEPRFQRARQNLRGFAGWIDEHLAPLLREKGQRFTLHQEPVDDIQGLLLANSLADYVRLDDGNMSSRFRRIEEALELLREYGDRERSCL